MLIVNVVNSDRMDSDRVAEEQHTYRPSREDGSQLRGPQPVHFETYKDKTTLRHTTTTGYAKRNMFVKTGQLRPRQTNRFIQSVAT